MSPYINQNQRDILDSGDNPMTPGELNYVLTKIILKYLDDISHISWPAGVHIYHYHHYNEIIGVLECVKQEIYRRVICLYEDKKCKENGDVFSNTEKE